MALCHLRYTLVDQSGNAIQNAALYVYQPATTTIFLGIAYDAKVGGNPITNPFLTDNEGEADAWLDTAQSADILITSNNGTAFLANSPLVPLNWISYREEVEIRLSPEDSGLTVTFAAATGVVGPAEVDGSGTSVPHADHGHAHGTGYLPDAHHPQVHGNPDHTTAYASQLAAVRTVTGPVTYTVTAADGVLLCDCTAGAITINLPAISSATVPAVAGSVGNTYAIEKIDSSTNVATLSPAGTDAVTGPTTLTQPFQPVIVCADTSTGTFFWQQVASWPGALTDVQIFTTPGAGTWTKPVGNFKMAEITVIGGGGGAGSGRAGVAGTVRNGGGGGGGAQRLHIRVPQTLLGATEALVVGAGGPGGAGVNPGIGASNNGVGGTIGSVSSFGGTTFPITTAAAGTPGVGGTTAAGGNAGGALSARGTGEYADGGVGSQGGLGGSQAVPVNGTGSNSVVSATIVEGGGGGGGGGGLDSANTRVDGATGGAAYGLAGGIAGVGVSAVGGAAGQATANHAIVGAGGGGGAGGNNTNGNHGGVGGLGGRYGGGGGGGGGASSDTSANHSGAGGAGGSGIVVVISY